MTINLQLCESIARDFPNLPERLALVLNTATFRREMVAFDAKVGETGTRGHTDEPLHRAMTEETP
jgi:hypothetical protein